MTQTNQTAQQQAARAAAAEQMAAKAAMQASVVQRPAAGPRSYPSYNAIIVGLILLAAIGSFVAMVMRG